MRIPSSFLGRICSSRVLQNAHIRTSEFLAPTQSLHSSRNYTSDPAANAQFIPTLFGTKEVARTFMAVFPDVVREVSADRRGTLPEVEKWLTKVMQYNVPTGKKYRGLSTVNTYLVLAKDAADDAVIQKACYLGWCVEMLHAHFLILDDITDNSDTRRGRPAWHKQPGVGMGAINDALLLEKSIYFLMKKKFANEPWYHDALDLFTTVSLKTFIGQCLDFQCKKPDGTIDTPKFTVERYEGIAKFKTGYYSIYLPVSLGMYLGGIKNPELHRQAKVILLEMGEFFQMQDDYLDCYGKPEVMGKRTNQDIEEGKVTWMSVMALQRANSKQKEIFAKNYGLADAEKSANIKKLYDEIGMLNIYRMVEKESYERIARTIQQSSAGIPKSFLLKLLDYMYKRDQ